MQNEYFDFRHVFWSNHQLLNSLVHAAKSVGQTRFGIDCLLKSCYSVIQLRNLRAGPKTSEAVEAAQAHEERLAGRRGAVFGVADKVQGAHALGLEGDVLVLAHLEDHVSVLDQNARSAATTTNVKQSL